MQIILIIFYIAAVYFLLVFVGLRLIAPFMGFKQYSAPRNIPPEIKNKITELENLSAGQKEYLEQVYNFVLRKWQHTRGKAAVMFPKLFLKDLNKIWKTEGFVYCTAINFAANAMLVNSKFFNASDVKIKHVFLNFVPHQYLKVKVGEAWVDFDPAGSGIRGGKIGTHATFIG